MNKLITKLFVEQAQQWLFNNYAIPIQGQGIRLASKETSRDRKGKGGEITDRVGASRGKAGTSRETVETSRNNINWVFRNFIYA